MTDLEALSVAISKSKTIISLLGPISLSQPVNTEFADRYRAMFPLMRQHSVRRIFAMSTLSSYQPEDQTSFLRFLAVCIVRMLAAGAYANIIGIQNVFQEEEATRDIDWTLYRIAMIPGGSDEESWRADRLDGETYVGGVAGAGWSFSQKRAALTRWLVDVAQSGAPELIRKMPAVSRFAGSKAKTA
jgi:hypothetical protein